MKLNNIIIESNLDSLWQYNIQKFKSLLTPSPSDDIEMMLTVLNHKQGGYSKGSIEKLLKHAEEFDGDLLTYNKWWMSLNRVFGFKDTNTLNDIISRILKEFNNEVKNNTQQPRRNKKVDLLKNLSNLYRSTNRTHTEGMFDNIRNLVANPEYYSSQYSKPTQKAKNIRTAKLAISMFTDIIREKFNKTIAKHGYTVDRIKNLLQYYNRYRSLIKSNTKLTPKQENAMKHINMHFELLSKI